MDQVTLPVGTKVEKPWGHEVWWAVTDRYVSKILHIKAGERLSRQFHNVKDESFFIISGQMRLELGEAGDNVVYMCPGASYHIAPGTIHRMIALTDVNVLEVSTPEVGDVVRLDDVYGRT